jgi:hypothetical protein
MTKKCYFFPRDNVDIFQFCTCVQTTVVFHYMCILTHDEIVIKYNDEYYHCCSEDIPLLTDWFNGGMNI